MIHVIYAADLFRRPSLAASMFRDRAAQFRDRHRWDVTVDDQGCEFDQYDELNPIYIIAEGEDGEHLASARLLPTLGRTMLAEHFLDITGGVPVRDADLWEVTRFCVSPRLKDRRLALRLPAAVMWAGCDFALRAGVHAFVGCCEMPMRRVLAAAGMPTQILGLRRTPAGDIFGGRWEVTREAHDIIREHAGRALTRSLRYFPDDGRFPFKERAAWPTLVYSAPIQETLQPAAAATA